MTGELFELAAVILVAAAFGFLAKLFRQPIVLAYLLAGLFIGYFRFIPIPAFSSVFSELGIMFLLFLVGLEINYDSFRTVGKSALVIGLAQILLTFGLGYWVTQLLHFGPVPGAYVAIALTFSSTILAVKILTEKKELHSLHGRIAIGILLIQDVVAILLLVLLAGLEAGQGFSALAVIGTVAKSILLFGFMLWLGRSVLPHLFDRVARSAELLFVITLAWVFLVAAFVSKIGFSTSIAGFLAGLALANSSEHYEIASRFRPLRDFFLLLFFVVLGASVASASLNGLALPVLILTLFVLIATPLVVLAVMGILGYRHRTGFMTGMVIAQTSEFSLVLVALGARLGHLPENMVSLVTAVAILTFVISGYLALHGERFFRRASPFLRLFERKEPLEDGAWEKELAQPIILVGAHRTGQSILTHIPAEELLVIDADPEVIKDMRRQGIEHLLGDIRDADVFERANFPHARLAISTSPDLEDNLYLLEQLNLLDSRPKAVVRAETEADAHRLYAAGADYVLLPQFTAGQYLGKSIAVDPDLGILPLLKRSDLAVLRKRDQ